MNQLIQKLCENRGYTYDFLLDINSCPHGVPKDTDLLCERLAFYHDTYQQIVLLTDFDMDGIMSGVLGFAGLAELGFNVALFLPDVSVGYGFNSDTIDRLVHEYPNVKAILTADVGVTEYGGIDQAKKYGLEVLVTDHHKTSTPTRADIVVDPCRVDEDHCYPHICGAHVLYQVLSYYVHHYTNSSYLVSQIERLRVFAGFGTISDSMPLYYENRPLVRDALAICRMIYADNASWFVDMIPGCDVYRRAFKGLFTMLSVFAANKKISTRDSIQEDFVGYYVAPTFNSIKRLGGNMFDVYSVFFGVNPEESMKRMFDLNEARKEAVSYYYPLLFQQPQPWAPYVYVTAAGSGIRGLLAQKLVNDTGEPVCVIGACDGGYSGSGRSPFWFPFLDETARLKCSCAGHNPAFGIGFDNELEVDELCAFLRKRIPVLKPPVEEIEYKPDFVIALDGSGDVGLDIPLFEDFLYELDVLKPFGSGFAKPSILLRFPAENAIWRVIGSDKTHLRIMLPYGFTVLCWNQAGLFQIEPVLQDGQLVGTNVFYSETGEPVDSVSVVGSLEFNEYNGTRSVQFVGSILVDK